MSKSLLYTVNSNAQTVTPGGFINPGSIVRRYGNNVNLNDGNICICGNGYYSISANVTLVATGTGLATVTIYKDNVAIPGATQSVTVETTGNTVAFSIPTEVRECCPCGSVITIGLSGAITSASVTNVGIIVEKS